MDDPKDRHNSFEDTSVGIGQNTDGTMNVFPATDLPKRTAERDSDEAATTYAIEQSEDGFPPEPEEDFADLEDA